MGFNKDFLLLSYTFSLPGFFLSTRIFNAIPTRFFFQDSTATQVLSTRIFYDIPTRFFYQDSTITKVLSTRISYAFLTPCQYQDSTSTLVAPNNNLLKESLYMR